MINPLSILFTHSDQQAFECFSENTAANEKILVYARQRDLSFRDTGTGGWLDYMGDFDLVRTDSFSDFYELADFVERKEIDYLFAERGTVWGDGMLMEKVRGEYELVFEGLYSRVYRVPEN